MLDNFKVKWSIISRQLSSIISRQKSWQRGDSRPARGWANTVGLTSSVNSKYGPLKTPGARRGKEGRREGRKAGVQGFILITTHTHTHLLYHHLYHYHRQHHHAHSSPDSSEGAADWPTRQSYGGTKVNPSSGILTRGQIGGLQNPPNYARKQAESVYAYRGGSVL